MNIKLISLSFVLKKEKNDKRLTKMTMNNNDYKFGIPPGNSITFLLS